MRAPPAGQPLCASGSATRHPRLTAQGEDPGTDFRGAGYIALHNLIAMATWHPHTYQRLLTKSEGARAAWEYPFAASATNVTFRCATTT